MGWRGRRCMSGCAGMPRRRAGGLADRSSRPASCPHQMPAAVEARIVGMRREHPGWGPSRICWELERAGVVPLPGRSAVYRALIRHGLVEAEEAQAAAGGLPAVGAEPGDGAVADGRDGPGAPGRRQEVKVVTGIDDHSRFIVCAKVVLRATARPVCQALAGALRRHGVPEQILTDNGKVFTGAVRPRPGARCCSTGSALTTGSGTCSPAVLADHDREGGAAAQDDAGGVLHPRPTGSSPTIGELQAALDAWVAEYNTARPHQSCGGRPPVERFRLADRSIIRR